ncbi:hypothetical protein H9L19_04555 [Weissella diestrammenae]|uniref:PH domain-containing protein n=1 Tax=Weissella diestrammenae TaxID=1162633 RepID=A0A7G9T3M4_9LACO|nr:hypothetical protein [Weissella diestrammenae]MCM0582676.1 hypothetical protein [Weissella diestrammenae]QNN74699.1 hypothetical protein H9L19_04555 [Weissella diestrammenae]
MKTRSSRYEKSESTYSTEKVVALAEKLGFSYPLWRSVFFGQKLELRKVADPTVLDHEEKILDMAPVRFNGAKALLVVTDVAVHILNYGLFGKVGANNETVYWSRIIGSNPTHHLIRGEIELNTGTANENDYHLTHVWHGDLDRVTQTIHHQLQLVNQTNHKAAAQSETAISLAEQLAQINAAVANGTITSEDAARAKDKLLS